MQFVELSEQHAQYVMLHSETQRGHRTLVQHLLTLRQQTPTSFTASWVKQNKNDAWQAVSTMVVSAVQTGSEVSKVSCKSIAQSADDVVQQSAHDCPVAITLQGLQVRGSALLVLKARQCFFWKKKNHRDCLKLDFAAGALLGLVWPVAQSGSSQLKLANVCAVELTSMSQFAGLLPPVYCRNVTDNHENVFKANDPRELEIQGDLMSPCGHSSCKTFRIWLWEKLDEQSDFSQVELWLQFKVGHMMNLMVKLGSGMGHD